MIGGLTGGCQCGRVRYLVRISDLDAYLCHCRMCRRATGGISVAFKNVRKADVAWTAAAPDLYRSSPIAERGFCAACGTPLSFAYPDSDTMDLTVGSFDRPENFVPGSHFAIEAALTAWLDTAHLPAHRIVDNVALVARWQAAGGLPE